MKSNKRKKILIYLIIIISIIIILRFDFIVTKSLSYSDCRIDYAFSLTNYGYGNIKTAGHSTNNEFNKTAAYLRLLECMCSNIEHGHVDSVVLVDTVLNVVRLHNLLRIRYINIYNFNSLEIEIDTILKYYKDFFEYDSILLSNHEMFLFSNDFRYIQPAVDSINNSMIYKHMYLKKVGLKSDVPFNIEFIIKNKADLFGPIGID